MAGESTLGEVITFFNKIGIYDVVLPFLLVFTIVFAILEKTKVFGTEKVGEERYTKKNLNAMVAFVIAFFVIASSQLVGIITEVSSNVVILLLLSVFFLMLVGSFYKEEADGVFLKNGWNTLFMVIMFIGIVAIFLNAIKAKDGKPWLEYAFNYLRDNWSSTAVASIILILFIGGMIYWITSDRKPNASSKDK